MSSASSQSTSDADIRPGFLSRTLDLLRLKKRPRANSPRVVWEIDALRGIAIIMMVIYHFMYDLYFFGYSRQVFDLPFWSLFQTATASLFILVSGVSTCLASRSPRLARMTFGQRWGDFARRGGVVFGWGMVLTLITRLVLGPEMYIQFGILHLIGLSIALSYPFLRHRWMALTVGVLLFAIGKILWEMSFTGPITSLTWLGFAPASYQAVDYFPFIQWFGLFLIGTFLGQAGFRPSRPPNEGTALRFAWPSRLLQALGQRSLAVYLLHQPVLFLLFGLVSIAELMRILF